MEAQGYTLTAAQATTPAAQEVKTKIRAFLSQRSACATAIRSKPQYAVLDSHLTGTPYSIAQLMDKSLATSAESQAVGAYYDEVNSSCNHPFAASIQAVLPSAGPIYERALAAAMDGAVIPLIERKITWGEYAERMKQRQEESNAQLNQIHI